MTKPIKPIKYPRWASEIIRNEISKQLNIYEPSERNKDIGWDYEAKPARQHLNWLFATIGQWIVYFDHYLNKPVEYKKSELPNASDHKGKMVFVNDIDGGILSYSDGTKWKKIKTDGDI